MPLILCADVHFSILKSASRHAKLSRNIRDIKCGGKMIFYFYIPTNIHLKEINKFEFAKLENNVQY